jgi:DNA polymerase III epsilon subunit-like protein
MGEFLKFLELNNVTHVAAHNAAFDYGFLLAAVTRSGLYRKNILPRVICTQAMAHYAKSKGVLNTQSLSLNSVLRTLGFPDTRNKEHSAIEDAILCEGVHNSLLGIQTQQTTTSPSMQTRRPTIPTIQRLSGR